MRDVADQLSSLRSVAAQRAEQEQALATARDAYDLAVLRYREGVGNYLQVLSTEDQLLTQQRLAADLRARSLDLSVALTGALGGGFEAPAGTLASYTVIAEIFDERFHHIRHDCRRPRTTPLAHSSDSAALHFLLSPSASTGLTRCGTANRRTMPM